MIRARLVALIALLAVLTTTVSPAADAPAAPETATPDTAAPEFYVITGGQLQQIGALIKAQGDEIERLRDLVATKGCT